MPELPEVEVVRAGLERWLVGRTISSVEVLHPRAVRRHAAGARDIERRLAGMRIDSMRRRGKYLWFEFADGSALIGHLGMSGQFLVVPEKNADEKHLRVRFAFSGWTKQLRFIDQRTFGGIALDELNEDGIPSTVAHIARDPFDSAFDADAVVERLRRRETEIKRLLLDQSLISGIGNIYADETLWRAKIHPRRPANSLTRPQLHSILNFAAEVLVESLRAGGTSFDDLYVNVNGESGYFERGLAVYGRRGKPCPRCGHEVRREEFMNRSSHYCPACQRLPNAAR